MSANLGMTLLSVCFVIDHSSRLSCVLSFAFLFLIFLLLGWEARLAVAIKTFLDSNMQSYPLEI
jgi:hypothetical protein